MASDNGQKTDRMKERQALHVTTLRGDLRDAIIRLVRDLPEHWHKMSGDAQQDVIDRIERLADGLVNETVDIVAARGAEFTVATLGKVAFDKGVITSTITTPLSMEVLSALASRQARPIVLVAREAEQFKGEKAKAEPDNVGALAMPRTALQESFPEQAH